MSLTREEMNARGRVLTNTGEISRTRQADADDADINKIMGKWRETGFVKHVTMQTPVYEDFSNAEDYLSSLLAIERAQKTFDELPARLRRRVDNDPSKLIGFVMNPNNVEELREFGVLDPEGEMPPRPEPPVEPAAEPDPGETN